MSLSKFALVAVSVTAAVASMMGAPAGAMASDWCFLACQDDAPLPPPVRRTIRSREVVEPDVYTIVRRPSVYGNITHVRQGGRWVPYAGDEDDGRILLRPYKNIAVHTPPRVQHARERVIVQPEGN
jgi:hypothetical protein